MKKILLLLFLLCASKNIFAYSENLNIYKKVNIKIKERVNSILKNQENASFELYRNDLLVGEYKTDKNGYINLYLEDGNYKLVQRNDINGYCYGNDYYFEIDEDRNCLIINDSNKIFNDFRKNIYTLFDTLNYIKKINA